MLLTAPRVEAATGREWYLPPGEVAGGRAVAGVQHLNAGRDVRVARVLLEGDPPGSLIVKYVGAETPGAGRVRERIYFQEELLNYRFLQGLPGFGHAPRLLGHGDGCFWLEDLGPGEPRLPTDAAMMEVVAAALVALHAATRGERGRYVRLRGALGYPPEEADQRALHPGSDASSFAGGARVLLEWSALLLPASADAIGEMLERAPRLLHVEQGEHALVHNDLISARQCVLRGGRIHLIDFEHARYGHRALDVAKVLMGKLEITRAGRLIHVHPSLPTALAEVYRRQWEARGGHGMGAGAWRAQLAAALCHQAVAEVGQCVARSDVAFLLGIGPTITGFLERLDLHLRAVDQASPFRQALAQLVQRMPRSALA